MFQYDLLFLVAEKREIHHLLKKSIRENDRLYTLEIKKKKIVVFITGVGKNAIKRSSEKIKDLALVSDRIVNIGNAGSIQSNRFGELIKIGKVIGANGKEEIIIDPSISNHLLTVKSIQDKDKLRKQYLSASLVDMELFYILKRIGKEKVSAYKIVLDTFKINPNNKRTKFFLPLMVYANSRRLSFFVKNNII